MNKHLYRIVFNKTRGLLMAVAETVASDGKQAGTSGAPSAHSVIAHVRPLCFSILLAFGLVGTAANAQIVADPNAPRNQQPTVLNSANGTPLVNIQTPSAAGVSRNTYSQFDVNQQGAILNNARTNAQTQLGGYVQGNPWLATGTARVILNEVNSSNPSQLRGYVEVAGDRAQVVIANPAGISCDGCGFINSNRVTLTTGTPTLNGGSLDGYRVQNGAISITGAGLDTSRADYTDIIARSVQVNAGIWANTLKVSAGANEVSADHGQTTAIAATGPAPSYGIDVAALGGMYAGKITLVGTESGVGVRNAGQVGASAGDVTVTADGRLENSGRITASAGVRTDTNGGVANSGTLYAQGDTQLSTRGNVDNTGTIAAQGNTTIAATGAGSSINSHAGSVIGAGVLGDGTLGGSGTVQVSATGQLSAQGQNLASGDLSLSGAGVSVAGSQTGARNVSLAASGGDVDASRATVSATQTLAANATGTLRTDGASASGQQLTLAAHDLSNVHGELVQTGAGNTSIQLPGALDNTGGRIATNGSDLSLGAQTLTNTSGRIEHAGMGTLAVNGTTVSGTRGTIASNGTLALHAQSATLDNGQTTAANLQIDAVTLSNRSGQLLQTGTGAASVRATNRLDNTGGTLLSNGETVVSAGDLLNGGGTLQVAGSSALTINASGHVDNSAQGKIGAGGAATLTATSLSNADGTVTAGDALRAQIAGAVDNTQGILAANRDVTVAGAAVTNAGGRIGSVQGSTSVTATTGAIDNTAGRVEAAQAVTLAANGLGNADGVVSGQDVRVNTHSQSLDNTRGTMVARGALDVQSGQLTNDAGTLQAVGALTIDTHGQSLINRNSGTTAGILGQDAVTLRTGDLNNSTGFIGAKGGLTANAAQITNTQGGQISGEKAITLVGTGLDNRGGSVQAMGNVSADVRAGSISNDGGLVRSGAMLDLRAGSVTNSGTQGANQGLEGQSVALTADQINNQGGAIRADQNLTLTGSGALNNAQGLISSGQNVVVQDRNAAAKTQSVTNTAGTLIAGKSLGVNSANLSGDGRVLSQGDLSLNLTGDFTNTGEVQANGNLTLQTNGRLTNQSTVKAGNAVTVSAGNVDNTSNGEISASTTNINAADTLTNRGLIDGGNTNINAGTVNNLGSGRIYGDHVAIQAGTVNNDVENGTAATIAARNRLDIGAQTITNREHALIFSGGDMAIGGALDANRLATGSAASVSNNSASIEALGNLTLAANRVNNTNEHFSTGAQKSSPEHIIEYQGSGSANRYKPGDPDVYIYNDESDHLHTPEGNFESWTKYEYDRTTTTPVVTGSDPGKITAGGAMRIDAGTVFNDKSQIIAGGTLTGNIGSLQNTEVSGQQITTDAGTVTSYWREQHKGRDSTGSSSAGYTPPDVISEIKLTPTVYRENTTPAGSGTQIGGLTVGSVSQGAQGAGAATVALGNGRVVNPITEVSAVTGAAGAQPLVVRTGGPNTTLPNNSLFHLNPNPTGSYLIETDPRFANYRTWLSSDYMLTQLSIDPANMHKRLGDGFYEQKLVREQVAQLTGRRFLDGYSTDEAQYRALIDNGVTYAKEWGLRPGVALTAAQMAQLTSDIVWLVEKDVTLPNGQTTKALVPQVYVRVKPGDLDGSGALIAGQSISLNLSGDVVNQGSIAGRDVVSITAENVKNLGGRITGGDVAVRARTDLDNLGGMIDGNNSLTASAGRDLNVTTTTRSNSNAQGSVTNVNRIAGLYVTAPSGGVLVASAGRDLNLTAAQIGNASTGGQTIVAAARDLNLNTVDTSNSQSIKWDNNNWRRDSTRQEVGSSIQTSGDLRLSAGNDLNARGASVTSEQGALVATAGNNVNLTAAETMRNVDEAHQHKGSSSWFSKKTITTRDTLSETTTQGTTFSGNTTYVQAGNDINVRGSNVVSTDGTTLIAKHDVNIEAATNSTTERHFREEKKSGLFSSGGIGFTIGTQQQSQDNQDARTSAAASTVGSTNGNVAIGAGNNYKQVGSNVVAPQGDITIQAKKVDILEAQETSHSTQETQFKQSGLTVAVTAPVIAAIQTAQQMKSAAGETGDARMKVLAGATTALAAKNAADAVASDPKSGGGVSVSITVGGSKSQSKTTQDASTAAGSKVAAG
ncbi:filamentous hemagglutinin N-terminal domain-containing protein, partial [Ralstonia sp. UBA689]|uniref:two-partner secretion domain-containing protein n=1 Tax=Ralstonia sp. UBA689 TaxID=1947373 RepID=UPI0025FFCF9F